MPQKLIEVQSHSKVFDDGPFQIVDGYHDQYAVMRARQQRVVMRFSDRTCCNKVCRCLYKLLNILYQAFWYYFAPFTVYILSYMLPFWLGSFKKD